MSHHRIVVWIFLSNLIEISTNAVQVHDKKLLYWKFVRAGIWLRFFDDSRALPPPYNLFNFITILKAFIIERVFRRNKKNSSVHQVFEYDESKRHSVQRGTGSEDVVDGEISDGIELTKELLKRCSAQMFKRCPSEILSHIFAKGTLLTTLRQHAANRDRN